MANPLNFEPKKIDPRRELQIRLDAAPLQHAEAILVAYDLLDEAHNQGLLDLLHGVIGSKNAIFGKLAEYAKDPVSTRAIRNLLLLARLLGSLDPEILGAAVETINRQQKSPSLWQIFKSIRSEEGRRGLAIVTTLIAGLGVCMSVRHIARSRR